MANRLAQFPASQERKSHPYGFRLRCQRREWRLNFLPLKSGSPTLAKEARRLAHEAHKLSQFPASQEQKSHTVIGTFNDRACVLSQFPASQERKSHAEYSNGKAWTDFRGLSR